MNLEIDGDTSRYLASRIGGEAAYPTVEDYVRDLIRQDQEQADARFEAYKAELKAAFAVPESEYRLFDPDTFFAEMRRRHA